MFSSPTEFLDSTVSVEALIPVDVVIEPHIGPEVPDPNIVATFFLVSHPSNDSPRGTCSVSGKKNFISVC
jgi:hypothetical protein